MKQFIAKSKGGIMEFRFNTKKDFKNFKGPKNPFQKMKLPKKTMFVSVFVLAAILYWFLLPPFNLHAWEFWSYVAIIYIYASFMFGPIFKKTKLFFKFGLAIALILGLLSISSSEFLQAKSYSKILTMEKGDFNKEIQQIKPEKIPTIDRSTASRLGSRKMGEVLDLVSQFNIDESYTQINMAEEPIRVTPLTYNGPLKWLTNSGQGIPYYLRVNMIHGEASLSSPSQPIRYSHSDLFLRDIRRKMRFSHPTKIFGEVNFEIDEKGDPYWISPTYKNRISWFGAMDVNGAIITNAMTGESKYYPLKEVPQWVDRVFPSSDILEQIAWNGKYKSGFLNSIFTQKGVLQATEGYNYIALNDDVYLYTGITSVAQDASNVGFVLVNLRTKDTKFYTLSSAEEFSAMESAEGEVQEKGYESTFPLLLNIDNKPTYFVSLKDQAGLIKMYAFIDAQNYQNVSIGNTVQNAYKAHIGEQVIESDQEINLEDTKKVEGRVADIHAVVIDGNTHFIFTLEGKEDVYMTSIKLSNRLPFLKIGDGISFTYYEKKGNKELIEITNIDPS